jgi:hypothetical protein
VLQGHGKDVVQTSVNGATVAGSLGVVDGGGGHVARRGWCRGGMCR